MTEREKRRLSRIGKTNVKPLYLHSDDHEALHPNLSVKEAWMLLTKLSKESWFIEKGIKAPEYLDKSCIYVGSTKDVFDT